MDPFSVRLEISLKRMRSYGFLCSIACLQSGDSDDMQSQDGRQEAMAEIEESLYCSSLDVITRRRSNQKITTYDGCQL